LKTAVVGVVIAALATAGSSGHAQADRFVLHRLVSDRDDPQLVNPWGLTSAAGEAVWVTNEAQSSTTTYTADGRKQAVTVAVPGGPTGIAFNAGKGFRLRNGRASAPARLLFACEDGMIRGWSPIVPRTRETWSSQTEVAVDPGATGTVFRGVTLAAGRLYATDFHNARVLVFDSRWHRVSTRGAFIDRSIPSWYAPFGIQAMARRLFVTYAFRAPPSGNDAPTGGYVDEFDLDGKLISQVGRPTQFDEPWGLALAPRGFGQFGGDLLVANFGSGKINAYARAAGGWRLVGPLPFTLPGVWGIAFGAGGSSGSTTTLFYVAGPHQWHGSSEEYVHGVFGSISPVVRS
jgi:uncharacterized protein (TIGR03118 family)